ncbi:hypothetical protein ACFQY7_44085 [Actinomadura luteofluorescens]|uniref:hypothetical protein n=1 Tax=Actinomadura luteofluorescens TaxID=46163 RepID=UPI003632F0E4
MAEDRDAWDELLAAGFLHALREAHREATLAVFGGLSRAAGFTERTYGVGAFDALASQIDRVFEAEPQVVRDDLNGSPAGGTGRTASFSNGTSSGTSGASGGTATAPPSRPWRGRPTSRTRSSCSRWASRRATRPGS